MFFFAIKQLLGEPARAVLSVLVFAAVTALIVLFQGIYAGMIGDLRDVPASLPADYVALEQGVRQFAFAPSSIPQLTRTRIEALAEVERAAPLTKIPVILDWNRRRTPGLLLALDAQPLWPTIAAGRWPTGAGELMLDRTLARRHGVALGEVVDLFDQPLTVVGLTSGAGSPFSPYLFVDYDGLLDLLLESGFSIGDDDESLVAALLVEAPAASRETLARELLTAAPEIELVTPYELGEADAALGRRLVGPVLGLLSTLAGVIGALTMGALRYSEVQAYRREIGVARALGARPAWLAGALSLEGLLTCALAALPAVALATGLAFAIASWDPLYAPRVLEASVLGRSAALVVIAAVIGSLLPLRRIQRLDPVLVFRR